MDERHSNLLTTESTSESDTEIGVLHEVNRFLENINTRNVASHLSEKIENNDTDFEFENNDRNQETPQMVIDKKSMEWKRKKADYNRHFRAKKKLLDDKNSNVEEKRKHALCQKVYNNKKKEFDTQNAMDTGESDTKNGQSSKNVDQDIETHRKKLAAIRAKNYRNRKTARKIHQIAENNSQAPEFASKDVPQTKKNIHSSQIAGPSHGQVSFDQENPFHGSQITGPSTKEVPILPRGECHGNYRIEASAVPISNAEIERVEIDKNSNVEKKRKHALSQKVYRYKKKELDRQNAMDTGESDTKNGQSSKNVDQDIETHRKKLAAIRAKNYRNRKRARKIHQIAENNSQAPEFASKDVPRTKKNIHSSQIAGPSHGQVPFVQENPFHGSQIAGPSTKEVPILPRGEYHGNYRIEASAVPISNAEIERVKNERADMTSTESDYEDHDQEFDYDNVENGMLKWYVENDMLKWYVENGMLKMVYYDNVDDGSEDGENDINNIQMEEYQQ